MATFEKRIAKEDGAIAWRAKIRRVGAKSLSKTFARKIDAVAWAREIETRHDRGYAIPTPESLRRTLASAIDRFYEDRLPELADSDRDNIRQMLERWRV